MLETRSRFEGSKSIVITSVLICIAVIGLGFWPSGARPGEQENRLPEIKNETESFQLVGMEREDRLLILRMKNTSNKAITAYKYSSSNGMYGGSDYILGDSAIAPEAIEEIKFPLTNLYNSGASAPQHPFLSILAVVFDDRSSEGDFKAARDIFLDRQGQRIQLNRINRLVRAALKSPDADMPAAISKLKASIASLPGGKEEEEPAAVLTGLRYMKQHVLKQLEELEQWRESNNVTMLRADFDGSRTLRDALNKLKKLNEKRMAIL